MAFTEPDIPRGLDGDEFFPVFQPLVELRTGQLAGFEVLARWQRQGAGLVMPDEFIPAVEQAGLINELSRVLLEKAFAALPDADPAVMLAFNLSPTQLLDSGLPARLESLASFAGFPLDRLTLEITESALLDDLPRAVAVVHDLKALHCRLALDDFGTGYSSLKHLGALPFDELKVDRSFVSSMAVQRESRKIVASVVGLGQSLGLMTVAEGVETREQAEMLFWLGCDLGQGWLFGRPVPGSELAAILAHAPWSIVAPPTPFDGSQLMNDPVPAHRVAQLQAVYDGAPVGLCFLDREMRYVNLNRQLAQMNGVPAAAHIGRTVAEVIPHVFPIVEPFIRRALQGEPVMAVEAAKPPAHEGDAPQTVVLSYQPVRDEAGDVLGVSVAIMDVTQRRRTEEALRESEAHYRHMIRLSPHVPWVLDDQGELMEASARWTEFTGQPMDEAMGHGWIRMLHPDDVGRTLDAIHESLKSGLGIDVEYRIRRPGAEWKWMRSRGAPRFGSDGKIVCIYGVVEEIEEHKQVTAELEICQAKLRAAIDVAPLGIILADGNDATIFMVNPCARNTFGNGVFPGQKLSEYSRMGLLEVDGKPIPAEDYPLARSIQRGETIESRPLLIRRSGGSISHLSVSSRPIRSDEGELIGGMMIVRDPQAEP
jgi:PAS domain S-box-containing protein